MASDRLATALAAFDGFEHDYLLRLICNWLNDPLTALASPQSGIKKELPQAAGPGLSEL